MKDNHRLRDRGRRESPGKITRFLVFSPRAVLNDYPEMVQKCVGGGKQTNNLQYNIITNGCSKANWWDQFSIFSTTEAMNICFGNKRVSWVASSIATSNQSTILTALIAHHNTSIVFCMVALDMAKLSLGWTAPCRVQREARLECCLGNR